MILVKFDDNWADEMDVSGFKLYDNIDAWKKRVDECDEEGYYTEVYFGTNEYNEYDSMDEFLRNFEVLEITDEYAAVIETLFPEAATCGYGLFPL